MGGDGEGRAGRRVALGADRAGRRLRLLEVAALPFPTRQGTQAMLRECCEALADRGHDVHLLVYHHGDGDYAGPVTLHRVPDWPRERSLRSGPSVRKVILDLRLAWAVRRADRELTPDAIHAHNYEALVAALAARPRAPLVYHAHTLFGPELPTFGRSAAERAAGALAGGLADRLLPPRADMTVAVSPRLRDELQRLGHPAERLRYVPPGISLPARRPSGSGARKRLGLADAAVIGYCGNLDRYQGVEDLLDAAAALRGEGREIRLLVVTASDPAPLLEAARRRRLDRRLVVVPHPPFDEALELISAADVCVVPRARVGGFPIKLLAYFAAERPVVSTEAGAAGLELGDAAFVVPDSEPSAMARAVARLLDDREEARRMGQAGRRLVERRFRWGALAEDLEKALLAAAAPRRV